MVNSTKITLKNNVPSSLATVTYKIEEGDNKIIKLTVPAGGSVQHPTDEANKPWVVSAIVSSLPPNTTSNTTVSKKITDPNASISCDVGQLLGQLTVSSSDTKEGETTSVLDHISTWSDAEVAFVGNSRHLNMTMQRQEQSNWCWAAVSVSTALFYDASFNGTQCELANWAFNTKTCCIDGTSATCDKPYYLDRALEHVGHLNQFVHRSFSMNEVSAQIDNGHPLGVRIGWTGGGGHFVVIDGYNTISTPNTIVIKDPWYGISVMPYNGFPASYHGGGDWTHSYTTN
ncbi:papain-like cysteine protease family protein [Neptuniibacter sp. PT8_73]|uniref:papain-like cysteine protease family protein n=1 Tax=unclassified Neptuniibacter TaxID=2630693 RepID=UPI0039F523E6